jgi:metallophosphoesterase superfamily enzyme
VRKSHFVIGHWHPAVRIYDSAGAGRKLPAFLASAGVTVLPAFSPFAGGVEYGRDLPDEIARLARARQAQVLAVTGKSVARVL